MNVGQGWVRQHVTPPISGCWEYLYLRMYAREYLRTVCISYQLERAQTWLAQTAVN